MARQPVALPSRMIEGGRLVTYKQDFISHIEGGGHRQKAHTVDIDPIPNLAGDNVQEALEDIFQNISNHGTGFVSIGHSGDGYDGYCPGIYNVTDEITFEQAFALALEDSRLSSGGTILILPGTYYLTETIIVPPAITILGDGAGATLVGEMVNIPMFKIQAVANNIYLNQSHSVISQQNSGLHQAQFINLNFFDNLNESVPSMTSVPFIQLETGSAASCHRVNFFGKLANGATLNRAKTKAAIGIINTLSQGTHLTLSQCYIDGCQVAINFVPKLGPQDSCSISNCRIRFFGKEAASYSVLEDSAFVLSPCQLLLSGNEVQGAGANCRTMIAITDSFGTIENARMIVSGNHGMTSHASPLLIDDQFTNENLVLSLAGNNWSYQNFDSWSLTIGDGTTSLGDLMGYHVLDLALLWANQSEHMTTLILNPGDYLLQLTDQASNNFSNVKLIGNKLGRVYPRVELDIQLDSSVDSLNQSFVTLGNSLEGIYFYCTREPQSIRPSFHMLTANTQSSAHLLQVRDCIFFNCSLNIFDPGNIFLDVRGKDAVAQIVIEDCTFIQDDVLDDTVSLVAPIVHQTILENCYFQGNGYAANLGSETYTFAGITGSNLSLTDVVACQNGLKMNIEAPGSASNAYFVIKDSVARVDLNHCQITAAPNLSAISSIDTSLLSTNALVKHFVYLEAKDISVFDSLFNGPNQVFQISSTDYALPCVYILPHSGLNFDHNKICSGGLPLQVVGTLSDTTTRSAIDLSHNDIANVTGAVTHTLIDIDIEPANTTIKIPVRLSNNHIASYCDDNLAQIYHQYHTGATYNTNALAQVYCRGLSVDFEHNKVSGVIVAPDTNPYNYLAGVFINNYVSDLGVITYLTQIQFSHNNVQILGNDFSSASSSQGAAAVMLKGSQTLVQGNILNLANLASVSSSVLTCLILDLVAISSIGNGLVTNNVFSRHSLDGTARSLTSFIYIASSTTVRGQICNNQFTSPTVNGSATTVISDNTSSTNKWWSENNKNQTKSLVLRGNIGALGVRKTSGTFNIASVGAPNVTDTNIGFVYDATSTVQFDYSDLNEEQSGVWSIPLYQIIPHGAYVVTASVDVDVSMNPSVAGAIALYLRNTSGSVNDTENPITTSGATLNLSPAANLFVSDPSAALVAEIDFSCQSSSRTLFTASQLTIEYRW